MMFKNTFKLLFANYSKVWKVFLYLLVSFTVTCGLAVAAGFPIYQKLLESGIFTKFTDIYMDFINRLNLQAFIDATGDWIREFVDILFSNMDTLLIYFILLLVIIFVFGSIVVGAYNLGLTHSMNYFMNSATNVSYTQSMLITARKNVVYHLVNIFILTPINLAITAFVIFALNLLTDAKMILLGLFVAVFVYSALNALKLALFGGWIPAMVVKNYGVFAGLKENFRVCGRRFAYTYCTAFGLTLLMLAVNIFGGICTFGVALIFTIPASVCAMSIFNLVSYYTSIGQRYYADATSICAPKRQEFTDQFNNHKYFI